MKAPITHVFADGGVIQRNPSTLGGTWAWCHTSGTYNAPFARVIGDWGYFAPSLFGFTTVENNLSELYAAVLGLEALPDRWAGTVCSDNENTIKRLRTWTWPPGEATTLNGIPRALQAQVWRQVQRLDWQNMRFLLLGGHPTRAQLRDGINSSGKPVSIHNKWCDDHCKAAADRYWLDQFPDKREVHHLDEPVPIRLDSPDRPLTVTTVRRSSQEMSLMARSTRAARPRYILGTRIGGSAESILVTASSAAPTPATSPTSRQ